MVVSVICAQSTFFSAVLEGIVLIPVCAVFVLQPTLGATLEVAFHIGGGAAISTAVAALIVSVLPASFPTAVGILAAVLSCMGMAEWPPTLKRFAGGYLVIELLVWAMPPENDLGQSIVDALWCARLLGSVAAGILIAVTVSSVFPALALHEARMRLHRTHEAHALEIEVIMREFLGASEPSREQEPHVTRGGTSIEDATESSLTSTAILVVSTVGVASEEQRLAEAVDLHASASRQITLAAAALRVAAWEPAFLFCGVCIRVHSTRLMLVSSRTSLSRLLSQASSRHHALQTMLTAQPLALQHHVLLRNRHHAPFVGPQLRARLEALTRVVARVLRDICTGANSTSESSLQAHSGSNGRGTSIAQLSRAISEVSAAVVASRQTALYQSGPEGHQAWHGAQLWSPMTLVHALLQVAGALAVRDNERCTSATVSCFSWWVLCRSCDWIFSSRTWVNLFSPLASVRRWHRTARLTIGVVVAALISWAAAPSIKGTATAFWAPVSVAFIAGGSESGSYRTVVQRLQGTLLGSTAGLLIAVFCALASDGIHETIALAVCLATWSAVMHTSRPGGAEGYWATVAAFTAPIIAINGGGSVDRIKAFALARMEMTWLGLCTFYVVAFVLPVSARLAAQRECVTVITRLNAAVVAATDALGVLNAGAGTALTDPQSVSAGVTNVDRAPANQVPAEHEPNSRAFPVSHATSQCSIGPSESEATALQALDEVDDCLARLPTLVDEAAYEPQLWGRPFEAVRERYTEVCVALKRGGRAARIIHTSVSALLRSRAIDVAAGLAAAQRSRRLIPTSPIAFSSDVSVQTVGRGQSSPSHTVELLPAMSHLVGNVVEVHNFAARCFVEVDAFWWQTLIPVSPSTLRSQENADRGTRADLARAAAALVEDVSAFTLCYDEFLHAYVEAKLAAAVAGPFPAPRSNQELTASTSCVLPAAPDAESDSVATQFPPRLLPPTDALWLNSASFALRELAAAALGIVRATREVHTA